MKSYKVTETSEAIKEFWRNVADDLANGGKLLIQVTHTSQSNTSYRYTIRLAYKNEQGEIDFRNLAYWVGAYTGEKVVSAWYGDELKGDELGTDRYFLAALKVAHILKYFGFIETYLDIATRRNYKEI